MAHILIVEDEAIVAHDLQMILEEIGHSVQGVASSAQGAVEQASAIRPDLVLMDIHLGDQGDGIPAATAIRAKLNVPIIFVTAYADPQTLQRAGVTGPFGYLLKPFSDREVQTTVEMALYRHRAELQLRESEQALHRERDELQRLVQERDEANRELSLKTQEIEQVVYTLSHDLKAPLVSLMGFLGVLKEDLEQGRADSAREAIQRMGRAVHRMTELIRDLLEFSRIGRIRSRPKRVDVNQVMGQVASRLRMQLEQAGAILEIAKELPQVWADPARLDQALENLVSNAIKYGSIHGGARITVGGLQVENEVRLYVRDNGPGVPPQYAAKIFELFQRLDNRQEGTGVGLAIVARVAQAHGGRAWVESVPGQGATFWIALPATIPQTNSLTVEQVGSPDPF